MESESAQGTLNSMPLDDLRPGLGREAHWAFMIVAVAMLGLLLWPHEEDDTAPMGNLVDASGRVVPLASQTAPVTLIHFWSTWCPPCITETPAIQRLAADYADNPRFQLVMVAVADDTQKVSEFLGASGPGLFDPDWKVARSYGTQKLPETHLVVRGRLVDSYIGAVNWDDPEIRGQIEDALGMAIREEAEEAAEAAQTATG
ncbi:uncharacterized protein LOC110246972 [Exaiptasia diaphana]|uniref:Peroxiredoxin-5, mitochondrial n=1 Tax=Exaiptasia diaphana TaxID=2652724 RepID=A0A913XSG6_EXADI|nr:uncharacterized protein LOC110246972 [Exaiptasia diaphana]